MLLKSLAAVLGTGTFYVRLKIVIYYPNLVYF
jgi:hypothetical protein